MQWLSKLTKYRVRTECASRSGWPHGEALFRDTIRNDADAFTRGYDENCIRDSGERFVGRGRHRERSWKLKEYRGGGGNRVSDSPDTRGQWVANGPCPLRSTVSLRSGTFGSGKVSLCYGEDYGENKMGMRECPMRVPSPVTCITSSLSQNKIALALLKTCLYSSCTYL